MMNITEINSNYSRRETLTVTLFNAMRSMFSLKREEYITRRHIFAERNSVEADRQRLARNKAFNYLIRIEKAELYLRRRSLR